MPSLVQRAFIQEMMAHRALPSLEATKLFNKCLENEANGRESRQIREDDLGDELEGANAMLRRYDFQITAAMHGGRLWWGIVNTARDDAAKLSCAYTNSELGLFQAIGTEIRNSDDGYIPLVKAQLLAKTVKLTVADGGRVITRLSTGMWLAVEKEDGVSVVKYGPRSILELPNIRTWARDRARGVVPEDAEVYEEPSRKRRLERTEEEEEEETVRPRRSRDRNRRTRAVQEEEEEEMEIEETPRRSSRNRRGRDAAVDVETRAERRGGRKKRVVEEEEDEILEQEPRPTRRRVGRRAAQQQMESEVEAAPRRRFTRSQKAEEEVEETASKRRRRTRR